MCYCGLTSDLRQAGHPLNFPAVINNILLLITAGLYQEGSLPSTQ